MNVEEIKKEYEKVISHHKKEYQINRRTNFSLHTSAEKILMGVRK